MTPHDDFILVRDGAAATTEKFNVIGALFFQKRRDFGEKLNVSTVVTGNADRANVFLDRSADDVADRSMIAEINDFDPVPDELEVDRIDRAVVPVTNRDGGQDSDW